jgi:hypothetical protein
MFPLFEHWGCLPRHMFWRFSGVLNERFPTVPFSHHEHESQPLYSTARTGATTRPGKKSAAIGPKITTKVPCKDGDVQNSR